MKPEWQHGQVITDTELKGDDEDGLIGWMRYRNIKKDFMPHVLYSL